MFKLIYFCLFILLLSFNASSQYLGFERADSIKVKHAGVFKNYPWVGGINSAQFSTIDYNNDNVEDLFIFDRTGNKVLTFLKVGNTYEYAPQYESAFPVLQSWVLLRDYNCDGKKDIFSYVSGGIGVWKNTSTGGLLSFEKVTDPYIESTQYNFTTNLFVSRADIPDINDIDGDGDLDVLTFGVLGSRIEYHKNLRVELGYDCDSIVYELKNSCWGHFLETGSNTNTCLLKDTCSANSNVDNPQKDQLKHTGSTILSLDLNNDNVKDLLLGDVSFNNIVALTNDNTGVNMNTSMVTQDTAFPSYNTSIDLNLFPATFYEDIDGDGVKDLIVSPNIQDDTENTKSVWTYKNNGTNTQPNFNFIEDNFIQKEMIEYGRSAYPVLFDYNNDGLIDLFVSSFGKFAPNQTTGYSSKVALYENIGSVSEPIFDLVTEDFGSFSSLGLERALYPTFADIDGDTDIDVLLGNYEGKINVVENTSNSMGIMTFAGTSSAVQDDNSTPIDVGASAKPFLFDIDSDGDYDLIVGEERGNLNYYENVGSSSSPSFRLQSETFGGVETSEWFTTIGNSIPYLYKDNNNKTVLLVGSERGDIFHYDSIDNNLNGNFNGLDTIKTINNGPNASPAIGELNNDTYLDLIIGNERGGLSYYNGKQGTAPSTTVNEFEELNWSVYPNPFNNTLAVQHSFSLNTQYLITDISGKLILSGTLENKTIDTKDLCNGVYLFTVKTVNGVSTKKIIKQ
jgi:hypothetical protein